MPFNYFFNDTLSVVVNQTFSNPGQASTPIAIWYFFAIISVLTLIVAVYIKLREQDGSVSPQKVMLSLVSAAISFFTAYLTGSIDVPTSGGVATAIVNGSTSVYLMENHTLYQMPGVVIFFVVWGFLAVGLFIYCITRKEIIMPDANEFRNGPESDQKKSMDERKGEKKIGEEDANR